MDLSGLTILVKGGGEVASAITHKLHRSGFKVFMTEIPQPLAVSRGASFCEAVYEGTMMLEGVTARLVKMPDEIPSIWEKDEVPLLVDPRTEVKNILKPQVLVDAVMAKRNTGTAMTDAVFVIGVGPGFFAGRDTHVVIESNNSENLGKVIFQGEAEPNTGIPLEVGQIARERAMFAPVDGTFTATLKMGDTVKAGDTIGQVDGSPIIAGVSGVLRAVLRDGVQIKKGTKLGEVDPRGEKWLVNAIRPRMRTIAGGVLEAVMYRFNK